ncbi:peptide chain release factor N(5)-glutamine methyltransferase [bacterium]|nr:peptide chain release factor N(5)-glutamine methyltransferase [bacterium]
MKTVLETLQGGTAYLEKRGVDDARLNMQLLLAAQLGCSKLDLYMQFDRPLGEKELAPLRELLKRRGAREPLQHLLGEVEFAGQVFKCDARALIPRPETEELVLDLIKSPPSLSAGDRIVDVGTGSGVIGLSLAHAWKDRELEIVLVDQHEAALSLAKENAESLELSSHVEFIQSNLLDDAPGPFAMIVANLPYVTSAEMAEISAEVLHDPHTALDGGTDGLDLIRRLIAQAATQLSLGGNLLLEIGAAQADATQALLNESPFDGITSLTDLAGRDRFVKASRTN